MTRIKAEGENITTDFVEIKRIIKEFYEQIQVNKLTWMKWTNL